MNLFQKGEGDEIEFTLEAKQVEPYSTLAKRKRPCKGDFDGKKKELNKKEALYVFYASNYDSRMRYMEEDEKLALLKLRLKLPDDWVPDELVKECIIARIEDQKTESTDLLNSAINAGKAMKAWYDHFSKEIKESPQKYKADFMIDFQNGLSKLSIVLDNIKLQKEKVQAEHQSARSKSGRLISRHELEE